MEVSIQEIIEKINTAQKAVQATALSAEIAFETQKGATEAINSLIQVIQKQATEMVKLHSELEEKNAEIAKLHSELEEKNKESATEEIAVEIVT